MTQCDSDVYHVCHSNVSPTRVVNVAITINVNLSDDLVHLVIGEFLSQVDKQVTQFVGINLPIAVLVEELEGELKLGRTGALQSRHHDDELFKVDDTVTCIRHSPRHAQTSFVSSLVLL